MKTKYRIVKYFNDSYGAQYKKWYQLEYRNIEMLRPRNDMKDVADDLVLYQEKIVYDKNKTVVWQSDQTEVKESETVMVVDKDGIKELPYNETLESIIKNILLGLPWTVMYYIGHWMGSHHF